MDLPIAFWLTAAESALLVGSLLILTVQKIQDYHQPTIKSSLKLDTQRDTTNGPFSNVKSLKCIIFCTFVSSTLSAYSLIYSDSSVNYNKPSIYTTTTGLIITFATWIYALVIALVSLRFPFPNKFGWQLNIHLFVLYLSLLSAYASFLLEALYNNFDMILVHQLPYFVLFILTSGLVYITGTVKRGLPFLDDNGQKVSSITVESIAGIIYFSWMSPLVAAAISKGKIFTDADLPRLPPNYRGYNMFHIFNKSAGRGLLYRIYYVNRSILLLQAILSLLSSCLRFASPFFLRKFLQLIYDAGTEENSGDQPFIVGLGYLLAMVASSTITQIVSSQLKFQKQANLSLKIISTLNIEIYRRTLCLTDISILSNKKTNSHKNNEEEDGQEHGDLTAGKIFNLMNADTNRLAELVCDSWSLLFSIPSELVTGFYLIYTLLGWSSFLGLFVIIAAIPVSNFIAKLQASSQEKLCEAKDKRVSLTKEALQQIRQIKLFAWESSWIARLMKARDAEVKVFKLNLIFKQLLFIILEGSPLIITFVSFWSFTKAQSHNLNPAVTAASISTYNLLSETIRDIPDLGLWFSEILLHVKRIEDYLDKNQEMRQLSCSETSSKASCTQNFYDAASGDIKIGFENATVCWPAINSIPQPGKSQKDNSKTEKSPDLHDADIDKNHCFTLKDMNTVFPNNKLSLICGATGSGKTLLMLSLLGEAKTLKGSVFCPRSASISTLGSTANTTSIEIKQDASIVPDEWIIEHAVAYVSQNVWLQNASIKENILFGLPFAEKRYRATLNACDLNRDLSYLKNGDLTEIGEKGIALSGGQKSRVALARAIYSRAHIVLMDDVLSAVDTHTAKILYKKCLMGPLMYNRTQILITHQVNLCIQGSAFIVFVEEGQIKLSGSPEELRQKKQLSHVFEESIHKEDGNTDNKNINSVDDVINVTEREQEKDTLKKEELPVTGMAKLKLYQFYFRLVGNWSFWIAYIAINFTEEALRVRVLWWLRIWTDSYQASTSSNLSTVTALPAAQCGLNISMFAFPLDQCPAYLSTDLSKANFSDFSVSPVTDEKNKLNPNLNYYLAIYLGFQALHLLFHLSGDIFMLWGGINASKRIYSRLMDRVFYAPFRYYDITPVGWTTRTLTRDFETIDTEIFFHFTAFFTLFTQVSGIVTTSIVTIPVLSFPVVLIGIIVVLFAYNAEKARRELRRIEKEAQFPLFTMFEETIQGIATIRAFGMAQRFMKDMISQIDASTRAGYYTYCYTLWISVRLILIDAAVNLITGGVILLNLGKTDPFYTEFCLISIISLTSASFYGFSTYALVESCFKSVERIRELLEIDQEAPQVTDIRPPKNWPAEGSLEVEGLQLKYSPDLDTVIKNLSFSVKPREKIGIVGRTGSGKSTLALSFFRFLEAASGSISIDGINIADIGLGDLRSKLTILPQDPFLFSGTLRSNMDPFDQFSDDELLSAFRMVRLLDELSEKDMTNQDSFGTLKSSRKPSVEDVDNKHVFKNLETPVINNGKDFSQGQRQLICLARALLHRSKVVIMDEATSSVDFETNKAIQKIIAKYFTDSTVLCIAHRLNTVMEYDRILVLDHGKLIEFSNPLELIRDSGSLFHQMCCKSGEFENLLELARAKHELINTT